MKKLTIDVANAIILLYLIFIAEFSLWGMVEIRNIPIIGINNNNISSTWKLL